MASTRSLLRLAHGWTLVRDPSLSSALVREFIRPAVRAVPSSLVRRLGSCRISLPAEVAAGVASRWTPASGGLEVSVMTAGIEEHDVAMELLLCLGQGLWERLSDGELRSISPKFRKSRSLESETGSWPAASRQRPRPINPQDAAPAPLSPVPDGSVDTGQCLGITRPWLLGDPSSFVQGWGAS